MDKVTALFDKFDLAKLVPPMDTVLEKLQFVAGIAVLAGPLVMLFLGLWYLLLPPKEANYKAGFRTWFGMGSVEAWRMTQKIAGFAWGGIGLILSVVMWFIRRGFAEKEITQVMDTAFTCVLWQVGIAAVSYVLICLTVLVLFNYRGEFRWKRREKVQTVSQEQFCEPEPMVTQDDPVIAFGQEEEVNAFQQEDPVIVFQQEEPLIME